MKNLKLKILVFSFLGVFLFSQIANAQTYSSYDACLQDVFSNGKNEAECCKQFPNSCPQGFIPAENTETGQQNSNSPNGGGSLSCPSGTTLQNGLCVPQGGPTGGLANSKTLMGLLTEVLKYLLYLAGAIAVLFIVIGGFQYITSSGDEEQAEKGRKTLTNAIIGLVVVIMSYAIIQIITNAVTKTPGT